MAVQNSETRPPVPPNIAPDQTELKRWQWLERISPVSALVVIVLLVLWQMGPTWFAKAWPKALTMSGGTQIIMMFIFMWVALASTWNLVGGYTGYIDFGYTVFFGIGGYTAGILMANLLQWPFIPAAIAAMIVSAVFALIIGWPTLRLHGAYFSIAMLGTFIAVRQIVLNLKDLTNGGQGISFRAPFMRPQASYLTFLAIAAAIFFLSLWIYRSQLGRVLRAIREDEAAADMRGINTRRLKLVIFALAAALTGLIGATRAYQNAYIDVDVIFPLDMTVQVIMMVMLGGIGRPWGPVMGAVLLQVAQRTLWASFPNLHLIITGVLLILIVLFMPRGLLGLLDPEGRGLAWQVAAWRVRRRQRHADPAPAAEGIR